MKAKVVARELLNRDLKIVPLFPKQKATHDVGWQNKKYQIEDILDDSNIGVNLHQSNLLDVDLETEMAMYFAKLYLVICCTLQSYFYFGLITAWYPQSYF